VSWLFGRGKKKQVPSKESLEALTLDQLAKAGGNLAMPTEIVNYLYLPDESRARIAVEELELAGYKVEVRQAAQGPMWLALAKTQMVPSRENIALLRERFESLASRLDGDFDGWEAAVTR